MKTTKEWIDTLPEDIRERAYKYKTERTWAFKDDDLRKAIISAFIWNNTAEGWKFGFWLLKANLTKHVNY